ncbi:hypothetical protein SFRURICE_014750 [Spodoptera frugiperda]|nr:hypothetical protein SFRURICE_014750 [Spodoptera frugiperda]
MEKTVRQQHKNFNQHLNKIDNLINSMQKQISENAYTNEFTLSSISANGILMNLKDIQQMLLNTITDIFHGDNLIFEIKLPLVGRDTFEVYKLTPIPIAIGDKMRQIIIASDLLAINYQKDLQIPLSSLQLQQCIHYDMDILLCAHQIPISITKTEPSYCTKEIESLSCKTESRKCKNTWVQLHKVNNYLYSCCGQCTVQVICDDQITIERLDKVGILALASGCVIKDDGITLLSRRQSSNDLKLKPDIINIDIPTINNIVNVTMPLHVSEIDYLFYGMSTIADLFAVQKEIMENLNKLYINFKKEGKERKTSESIKRRLQSLETLWRDFSRNHDNLVKLCDETEDNEYFGDDSYIKTKTFYNDVKKHLLRVLEETTTRSPSPKNHPPTPSSHSTTVPLPSTSDHDFPSSGTVPKKVLPLPRFVFHDVDKPNKVEEMMRKQQSNFKALARTISQINLNVLSEKWEFKDVLKTIESRWAAIDSLHWEIDSNLQGEDSNYEDIFNRYENEYCEIKKSINQRMWDAKHRDNSTPKIDIPIFNGNYQQWISFKDLFNESIHNNNSISPAQKMQFLKMKLRGEAEKLIQHLRVSSDNYQTCWDILNQRYNNKKLIFNSHMNVLMSLPVMHQQTASSIKKLHDTTNECLNALKNLGIDISTWDPIVIYLVSQKMDAETYTDYIDSLPEPRDLPHLQEFLAYLEGKFIALETVRRKTETNKNTQPFHNPQKHSNQSFNTSINVKTQEIQDSIMQIDTMNTNHLLIILLSNHIKNSVRRKKPVAIATKSIIRYYTIAYVITNPVTNQTHTNQHKQPKCVSHVSKDNEPMTDILLATAQVNVLGADGTYKTMRALIDQGSQTSIISENAAQQLGIHRRRCKGSIFGIGAKESYQTNLSPNHPGFLKNIQLADPEFNQSRPVDLLLGAEVYSEIILHGIIKEDQSQPIAQQTQLGWILCGNVKSYYCNPLLSADELGALAFELGVERGLAGGDVVDVVARGRHLRRHRLQRAPQAALHARHVQRAGQSLLALLL